MKTRWVTGTGVSAVLAAALLGCGTEAAGREPEQEAFKVPAWQVGAQAYSFRRFTFLETLDKLKALGIGCVEAYPGQALGGDLEGKFDHGMSAATQARVKEALGKAGVRLVAYGVVGATDEAGWRKIFDFAKAMGIETITSEPDPAQMALVSSLADAAGVNVALHNHPKPSRYWDADTVLAACKGLSPRVGACADTGHWARSGLDPLACLKKLEGRIVSLHFKDLNKLGEPAAEDVPWGTGVCNTDALLAELARQGFKGLFSIEYEKDDNLLAEHVGMCADYLKAWKGPARMSPDIGVVLASAKPGPGETWSNEMFEKLAAAPQDKGKDKGKGLGPQADTSAYVNTTGGGKGKIAASGEGFATEGPGQAFDGTPAKFCIKATSIWIAYAYADGAKQKVDAYTIMSANDNSGRDPRQWTLLGSNDGAAWTELDSRKDENFANRHEKRLFEVKSPGAYNQYKLVVDQNHGDVSFQLSELELLAKKP